MAEKDGKKKKESFIAGMIGLIYSNVPWEDGKWAVLSGMWICGEN